MQERFEQTMAGVVDVLDYTIGLGHTSSFVCGQEGRKLNPHNALRHAHHSLQCLLFSRGAVAEPGSRVAHQNTLGGAGVKLFENASM